MTTVGTITNQKHVCAEVCLHNERLNWTENGVSEREDRVYAEEAE